VKPDYVFVIDTVSCCNPVITGSLSLGKGPVARFIDNECIASLRLLKYVKKIANNERIPLQICSAGGTTDALELQEMNIKVLHLGVATKYTHSVTEMCSIDDIKYLIELVHKIILSLAREEVI